jgi:signal transduction histidine kinase
MRSTRLEPGILTIFRLFLIVQFILILVGLTVHHARGYLEGNIGVAISVAGISILVMLCYLSSPWLGDKLGRFYLPIALVASTVFSLLAQNLFMSFQSSITNGSSEESAWQQFLFLFIPLLLIGWQYGFKYVIVFCLFTLFVDYILIQYSNSDYFNDPQTYHRLLFIRFISFLLVGYIISRIMEQLHRQRRALQEANLKLEDYVATLEQLTISRERNRLARELHDTLTHTLSGVAVQLEAVDSLWASDREQAHHILQSSLKTTRSGLTETRKAIQSLRATPLEDLGLMQAMREYTEEVARREGFQLHLDLPKGIEGLPAGVEQCFYRIGQEAIENTAKHAHAKSVWVRLERSTSGLQMEIKDDGAGFDLKPGETGRHFGLQGMRERAQIIGAALEISSRPGEGTSLKLTWNGEHSETHNKGTESVR